MFEGTSAETSRPAAPRAPEAPEILRAFVTRHIPFFILVAVLLAQLIFLAYQVRRKHHVRLIKVWAVNAIEPFERSLHGLTAATTGAWSSFHNLSEVERENRRLHQDLAQARAQVLQLSLARAENERLRGLLALEARLPYRATAATVIAASPGTNSAVFIDKGSHAALRTDLPVITAGGVVGKIVAVFRNSAQVLTITDAGSGVGAMLEGSGVEGVIKGDGNGLCRLDYILDENRVSPGDPVVTSGLDQIYPRGLLVGRVAKVSDGAIYKHISVRPAAALDRLEDVLVILPSSPRGKQAGNRISQQ
jgi:rod shape-determining protein MreC